MIESTDVYTTLFFFHQVTSTSGPYLIAEGSLYVMVKSPFPSLYSKHYEGLIEDFRERFNPSIGSRLPFYEQTIQRGYFIQLLRWRGDHLLESCKKENPKACSGKSLISNVTSLNLRASRTKTRKKDYEGPRIRTN